MTTQVRIDQQSQAPTREASERVAADARLQEAFLRAMTRGSNREVSQSAASELQQRPCVPWSATLPTPTLHDATGSTPLPQSRDSELTSLLERFGSEVYVAEGSRTSQPRLLLALQSALPGASAEIVREGAFLRVRLRAGSAATYDRIQSRRGMLVDALTDHGSRADVIVEVIYEQGAGGGSAR